MAELNQHNAAVHEFANKVDQFVMDKGVRARFITHIKRFCKMVEDYGQALQLYEKRLEKAEALREKNKSVIPPKVVIGKFDSDNFVPDAVDTDVEVLNGLAVSPGIVTGKARVILKADTDEQVLTGEILVAPFTDPGWTPYFVLAAAIVMDQGGLLSHGSIIARKYGIPAVVNVGPATKIIKTGQTIQVDANRGIVRILK